MRNRTPRAILSTLLIAGVFYAPLYSLVHADEQIGSSTPATDTATTTPSGQVASTTEPTASSTPNADTASSSEPIASSTPQTPLPTGVLLDYSTADEAWSLNIRTGGHYVYYFKGYETLGNPPVFGPTNVWVTTGTTTTARVQKMGSTTCEELTYTATSGLGISGPNATNFGTDQRYTRQVGDSFCDFHFYGEGIPPGTALYMAYLGTYASTTIAGSHTNPGTSVNGANENPEAGGFSFQLCGVDGCSGGFGKSPPPISNVLFLPGIKGSRLYRSQNGCDGHVANCTDELVWEPSGDDSVRSLFLDINGKSVDKTIHTKVGDVLTEGKLFGTSVHQDFYASFVSDMNTLQSKGTIPGWSWKSIAYDWRLSLPDIINNGAQHGDNIYYDEATSTPYIEQTLRKLAHDSRTGKVTIIAHSNGGLVAKALMQKLGDSETANLIDKVIFVGVPQSGAPQAIGAELFGYGESLPFDVCANAFVANLVCSASLHRDVARTFAENSPMGYHLLPSARYFADTPDANHPVITFNSEVLYKKERDAYGFIIQNSNELANYLLSTEGARIKPRPGDLTIANVLNPTLMNYAVTLHNSIDAWVPPTSVQLYQIAGWGDDTVSGIEFYDEPLLVGSHEIGRIPRYRPMFVEDGDRVVTIPSAQMINTSSNTQSIWINLIKLNRDRNSSIDHGTLLEIPELRSLFKKLISGASNVLPDYISFTQPPTTQIDKKLIFFLHSPLTLELYDSSGNHTGPLPNGNFENSISGVQQGTFGEVKYIIAPAGQQYRLVLNGLGTGTFSLDIQEQVGNNIVSTTTISNVPTTEKTKVSLTITNGISDSSPLQVDEDGDGVTDFSITPVASKTLSYQPVLDITSTSVDTSSHPSSVVYATSSHMATSSQSRTAEVILKQKSNPSEPPTLDIRESQRTLVEPEPTKVNDQVGIAQTASVYTAFNSLRILLYNGWISLLNWILGIFK